MLKRYDHTHGVTGIGTGGLDDGVGMKTCRVSSCWGYEAKPGVS